MKTQDINATLSAFTLLVSLAASPLLVQPAWGMEASAGEAPEEIIVTGRQPLRHLKLQIELAQDRMFGLFNELNGDDRYDILCHEEQPLGTRISQRVCRPEFLRKSMELNAKAFLEGVQGMSALGAQGAGAISSFPPQAEINYRYPILRDKMNALVEQNPEFAESVAKHHELIEEFQRRTSSSLDE